MPATRPKDFVNTATTPAADDYLGLDGATQGTRKMLADTFRSAANLTTDLSVTGSVERTVASKLSDLISVKDFGAKGDNSTDDTAALQSAIDSGRALWLPAGSYRTGPLTYTGNTPLILIGECQWEPSASLSRIVGLVDTDDDQPLISRVEAYTQADGAFSEDGAFDSIFNTGYSKIILKNLQIIIPTQNKLGSCIEINRSYNIHIEQCRFWAPYRGITVRGANFDSTLTNIKISSGFGSNYDWQDAGDRETAKYAWGVYADGHTAMSNIMAQGCGTGVAMTGVGASLQSARIESCGYGILVGAPVGDRLSRSLISGVSTEACGYGFYIENMESSKIVGCGSQGTVTQPWPQSFAGIYINKALESARVECYSAGQSYQHAAVINNSGIPIYHFNGGNNLAPNVAYGGQNMPLLTSGLSDDSSEPTYHFFHTSLFPNAVKRRHTTMTAFHDLMLPGLTGLNLRDRATSGTAEGGPVFAKNLGGVVSPDSAATSASVTFLLGRSMNQVAISGIAAEADVTSTLEAGTYYYATTVVGPHGETTINFSDFTTINRPHRSIEVASGEKVVMSFFNTGSPSGFRRRVYRGRSPGVFEGCYEYPNIDDHSSFEDNGSIVYSLKQMPGDSSIRSLPSREEDDADYQIVATPSWGTTVHVTGKTTTGFTLNFGTAAPDANQTVAWLMFRP